ncbi:MAG: ABC transporter ATP-binding protein [Acidimicrobiia bacterium]
MTVGSRSDSLQVTELAKSFAGVTALAGLTFAVDPGRIVGFLGPNGAGKTTAMRCVLGLLTPDAGSVAWGGRPLDEATRLTFGYMPEERGLYPKMKIAEQLAYFGRLSGMTSSDAKAEAGHWLDRMGLADRADAKLELLSHGNQQRVQLVAALIHRPRLAVLDEPFAGLDPLGVETMSKILVELSQAGTAVLFSSHQLDLVEDVCQDVVVIEHGAVVLAGELARLRSSSTLRHLEIDVDDRPWSATPTDGSSEVHNGRLRHVVTSDIDLEGLVRAAGAEGRVTRLVFEPPSLSDLFREAVQR